VVCSLGYGHPAVIAAIRDQLDALAYAHSGFFTTEALEGLAADLVARAPRSLDHAYTVSGGSEAVEAALRLARQYFVERGEAARRHVITRRRSFHSHLLGGLATGDSLAPKMRFAPLLFPVTQITPCYEYRYRLETETEQAYARRAADALEDAILELGPQTVCAFVAETVVGATLGAVPAVRGYFERIREICTKYSVLLILDEAMCGMGRTGTLFAFEQEAIVPDLVALGRGLGAGYQPIGAVLVSRAIHDAIRAGSGVLTHGHAYSGHAPACAAARAVLRVIDSEELLPRVRHLGARLRERLIARLGEHPHVGDIRGRGLLLGIELVADRAMKAPFDPALAIHRRVRSAAMARGLLTYPMGGTVDGHVGDHVLLAPPFIITDTDVDRIVDRIAEALDEVCTGFFDTGPQFVIDEASARVGASRPRSEP
jgi:adenosylmethionine-8-amino-7-oxononanoate aminotransferase